MVNVLDAAVNMLRTMNTDIQQSPLHIGEAMSIWTYTAMIGESITYLQIGLNTTQDNDLVALLKESLEQCQASLAQLKELMIREGLPLPPLSEPRPDSDPSAIPLGVKLTDAEIANGVNMKTMALIILCSNNLVQSLRNDIAMMWLEFFENKVKFSAHLKTTLVKRGWLKVPPYYHPPGVPESAIH